MSLKQIIHYHLLLYYYYYHYQYFYYYKLQLIDIVDYYLLNCIHWKVFNAATTIDNVDFTTAIVVIIVASTISSYA